MSTAQSLAAKAKGISRPDHTSWNPTRLKTTELNKIKQENPNLIFPDRASRNTVDNILAKSTTGGRPTPKPPFDDSNENLRRIANTVSKTRIGVVRTSLSGPRKPSVMRERNENQEPGNAYARSKGAYVAVMDQEGYPDNLYLIPGNPVLGVEWKAAGKKPSPEQAQRILELRKLGWVVRVFDSLEGFRIWLDGYLLLQVAA